MILVLLAFDDFILFVIPVSFNFERKAAMKNMAEKNVLFNCITHCLIPECLSACALKIITQKYDLRLYYGGIAVLWMAQRRIIDHFYEVAPFALSSFALLII